MTRETDTLSTQEQAALDRLPGTICWACGDPIRLTSYGYGHCLIGPYQHHASPTKPIRRQRKAKETNHG